MRLNVTILIMLLIGPGPTLADSFRAEYRTIIHSTAKSDTAAIGYMEVGEYAKLLSDKEQFGWIKIEHKGVVGWVYKTRGDVFEGDLPGKMNFWFGNLHAHTSENSRERNVVHSTRGEAFNYAKDNEAGGLDFLALTPHNHLVKPEAYANLLGEVNSKKYYKANRFVPIAGQEFSTANQGNHVSIFELFQLIESDKTKAGDKNPNTVKNGDFKELFESFIPAYETEFTFAQFNHPKSADFSAFKGAEYGRDDYDSDYDSWIAASDPVVQLIEIMNSPMHEDSTDFPHYDESTLGVNAWLWALSKGWHLAPVANQANHQYNWGNASDSRTVAISQKLTRKGLLSAFRQRRCYASEDSSLMVTFKTGGLWMGSEIRQGDFSSFVVSASDAQEPDAVYRFELHRGSIDGPPLTLESEAFIARPGILNGANVVLDQLDVHAGEFYFIKVTQSNSPDDPNQNSEGDNAWTAPIWIIEDDH